MRTVITETKVYTIDELEKKDSTAFESALSNTRDRLTYQIMEIDWQDTKESLEEFLETFNLKIVDYQVGMFDRSHIVDNSIEYKEQHTNAEINEDVKTLNKLMQDEFYNLTGVWSDYLLHDYFKENNIESVTYNDIHQHLQAISEHVLWKFKTGSEEYLLDENSMKDYAHDTDLEFHENGEIYIK